MHDAPAENASGSQSSDEDLAVGATRGSQLDEQPKQPESSYVVSPVPTKMAPPALPDIEAELRKLPDLDEDDIDALLAMCKAGIEYAPELRRRKALRGLVPVCKYTGKACAYDAGACTCMLPGFVGDLPTEWAEPIAGPSSEPLLKDKKTPASMNSLPVPPLPPLTA